MTSYNPPEEFYGHEAVPEQVITYRCEQCGRELKGARGAWNHQPRSGFRFSEGDVAQWYKQQQEAAKAARQAKAQEYHGAIKQCQASVPNGGRDPGSHRCGKKARYVYRTDKDVFVVCTVHVKNTGEFRYQPIDWQRSVGYAGADEQVEEEYR